ncbi:pseudaminic acid synthase [Candidatus Thioglobus sp.]|nr:pseudaminic acid synthase [Candidatus Thioglobus sp.]
MNKNIKIGNILVGEKHPPFIVAEMSGNHNQSIENALEIVEKVAKSGAHAIKLQTYTADTLTINKNDGDFFLNDKNSLWNGMSMYELYELAHTPWEWHKQIFKRCDELGLLCFSSPFDVTAVDFLEGLNCPCYKIGSTENTDVELLKKVALTGKPLIISTGMATIEELGQMLSIVTEAGCQDLILLKCTAAYPARASDANLLTIPHMRDLLGCQIGLSDHTLGVGVAIASIAMGATMVEKHFTISRQDGGVDAAFSMEPNEFKLMVEETKTAWESIGTITYGPIKSENSNLSRRSLYFVEDIKKGELITKNNMRSIRPGYGLPVKYIDDILGMRVTSNVKRGTRVNWNLVK